MSVLTKQVSNGDLAEAVAFLTEKNTKVPHLNETTYYQTAQIAGNDRYISVGSQADTSRHLNPLCWPLQHAITWLLLREAHTHTTD